MPPIGYVAYIDEAGDDGTRRVRPIDYPGATEWFAMAAIVIEAENDLKVQRWLLEGLAKLASHQRTDIHFAKLDEGRRVLICNHIASLPARAFLVVSNKKNMRGYRNRRAEKVAAKNWFYNYIARVLLEKVTRYCYQHSMKWHKEARKLRVEFSTRGGTAYPQTRDYLAKLYIQSQQKTLFNSTDDLAWDVVNIQDIHHFDHHTRAGLQLADVIASAFYQGLAEVDGKRGNLTYARILAPRLAKSPDDSPWGVGMKFMPNYLKADLTDKQREIFELFGAPRRGGRPPVPHTTVR